MIYCFLSYELYHTRFVEMNLKVVADLSILPVKILPMNIRVIHSHVGQRCRHDPVMPTALKTD